MLNNVCKPWFPCALVAVLSLVLVLESACEHDSSTNVIHVDSGTHLDTTERPAVAKDSGLEGTADDPSAAERAACGAPIPEGELQNRTSGPSVFGRVVGGDLGLFDAVGGTGCGIAEVRICLFGTNLCVASDQAGQYFLGNLPAGESAEISFEKPGFQSVIRLVHLGTAPINLRVTRFVTVSSAGQQLEQLGLQFDDSKAAIIAIALAPSEAIGGIHIPAGVSMALLPGGQAPVYSQGEVVPGGLSSDDLDSSLSATRSGGWGIFFGVDPGDYVVHFEREGTPCRQSLPGYGYGIDDAGNLKIKVVAGFTTTGVAALCP